MRCVALFLICVSMPPAAFATESTADKGWPPSTRVPRLATTPTPLRDAIVRDARVNRMTSAPAAARSASRQVHNSDNWIERHPALFGSIVGFFGGFLTGFLPGDDAVFDDFDAGFNGFVLGGVGAGVGAIAGWAIGRQP